MAMCKAPVWCVWPTLLLLCVWMWEAGCDTRYQPEEEEIFHSDKQAKLQWTSDPAKEWHEISLTLGTDSSVPVLQACGRRIQRSVLSHWMPRKDAHYLLLDVAFAQEVEPSGQLSSLQVHLLQSDRPITRFRNGFKVLDLQTSEPFPDTVSKQQISNHMNHSLALSLGSVSSTGFHLAFSYSGVCVLVSSVRLYYKRCPDTVAALALFKGTVAGSGLQTGSCVKGAAEVSLPLSECNEDGLWVSQQGGCNCEPGHQVMNDTCQVCGVGYYKPANDSGGCRLCPLNSRTQGEGSRRCECQDGFRRLPVDPDDVSCSKPPSAPVNLSARHQNDSVLVVSWDPPHDRGGRQELTYHTKCEEEVDAGSLWGECGDTVLILPDSAGLTSTSITVMGLNPQRNYRLSVLAWNDISTLQGAPPSSTATLSIHRFVPVVTTVASEPKATAAPLLQSRFYSYLAVAVLFGILLLVVVIPIVVWFLRRGYTKPWYYQEHMPIISYRRPQEEEGGEEEETAPQQANNLESVVQLLEGLGGGLLDGLKEVLVERNKLTLGKELGRGEFGSVYEGVFSPDIGVDIKVAVKTMRAEIHNREDLHEFLKEAELMQNFDHENVVRLLGITLQREADSTLPVPLVILPYMKHGDLRRFLTATRYGVIPMFVPYQSLLRFMIDIAAGMEYLSSKGFLHRDLAARNCMLGDDLRVCVADFGLSKKIYDYYRPNVTVRMPIKWMAVESLSESVYTTKTDVWSFGVTMWEIVSRGLTPYPGVHNHDLLELLLSGHRLKQPTDCDDKLYEVMQSCWAKEPARRPGFRELGETLKGLLSELPVLEAHQEADYINLGLEAAAAVEAASLEPQTEQRERGKNMYMPSPVGAAAAAAAPPVDVDVEDGYLKYTTDPEDKSSDNH